MNNASLLLMLDLDTGDVAIKNALEQASKTNAFVRCVVYAALPVHPFSPSAGISVSGLITSDHWPLMVTEAQLMLYQRVNEIETILTLLETPGSVSALFCANAEIKQSISDFARTSDMMHIADNLRQTPDVFEMFVHAALFEAPVPVVLNTGPLSPTDTVFLAWDDSNAAARAAHMALPHLMAAGEVTVGCFDPITDHNGCEGGSGADVAAWLGHHGCNVTVANYTSSGHEIGSCLLAKAKELGSDLVVMGAYGHSRMRQTLFGGTTRTMIRQTEMPVLLAH